MRTVLLAATVLLGAPVARGEGKADPARAAIEKGLRRIEQGASSYVTKRTCFSCHHQAMAILSTALRRAGIPERDAARLVLFDGDHHGHEVLVEVGERPPLRTLAGNGYRTGDELTA